jgi:hypothetical protein
VNIRRLESKKLVYDDMIVNEHNAVLLIGSIAIEIPAGTRE